MEASQKKVEIYLTVDGKSPFSEWLDGLRDIKARAKIRVRIDRVSLGNFGDCRPVGHGVMELKIDFGPGYRVYFGQVGEKIILLLCGGDKGTQRLDIAKAKVFLNDYRKR
jgi:putative addiction module killer protein